MDDMVESTKSLEDNINRSMLVARAKTLESSEIRLYKEQESRLYPPGASPPASPSPRRGHDRGGHPWAARTTACWRKQRNIKDFEQIKYTWNVMYMRHGEEFIRNLSV